MRLSPDSPLPRSVSEKDACLLPVGPQPARSWAELGVEGAGAETLPCVQTHKLACHGFIDAGRRAQTPGSKTKDFVTYTKAVTRASQRFALVLRCHPSPTKAKLGVQDEWVGHSAAGVAGKEY